MAFWGLGNELPVERTFLAGLEACLFTKICCSKKRRGENFKEDREEIVHSGFIRHGLDAGNDILMIRSAIVSVQIFMLLIHYITEQNTNTVCCHDLFICFVTMDLSSINQAACICFILRQQIFNLLKMCVLICVKCCKNGWCKGVEFLCLQLGQFMLRMLQHAVIQTYIM